MFPWHPKTLRFQGRISPGYAVSPKIKPFTLKNFFVEKPSKTTPDIGIARGQRIDGGFTDERIRNLILKATDPLGGMQHYIKPGDVVLVKPNVAFDRSPNLGATSNPQILEQLIRIIFDDCKASEVRVR